MAISAPSPSSTPIGRDKHPSRVLLRGISPLVLVQIGSPLRSRLGLPGRFLLRRQLFVGACLGRAPRFPPASCKMHYNTSGFSIVRG
jgi:hypothetical protein